ncbi:hypothetical protein KJS94_17910 [Flavihumibacter rivuli]|uniref:hypothetical protein n=1 Tax=Flavihumibacter rivuli TaxID=2838156 RepID=UPI001BDEE0B3|nr:hypothetical protein [Flavihumibacter rivuli]ULQ56530.1 hypothetical protein KJS94_17910 [Flavihumibacter rivuli]
MKLRWQIFVLVVMLAGLSLAGCQKEISDPDGGSNGRLCTGCEFLPACDSSYYVYVDSTANGVDSNYNLITIEGDSSINGRKFYKMSTIGFFGEGIFFQCGGGDYQVYGRADQLGLNLDSLFGLLGGGGLPPGTLPQPGPLLINILKSSAGAGAQWTDNLYKASIFLINLSIDAKSTMLERLPSYQVLETNFTNVLRVRSNIVFSLTGSPDLELGQLDVWYASGVGIIRAQAISEGALVLDRKLARWQQ